MNLAAIRRHLSRSPFRIGSSRFAAARFAAVRFAAALGLVATLIALPALVTSDSALHGQDPFEECDEPDAILDGTLDPVDTLFDISDDFEVADVAVSIDISHSWIGDLHVAMASPSDTEVTLHDELGIVLDDIRLRWTDSGEFNGSESYDCECDMRPSGPGRMSDFYQESAIGEWRITTTDVDDTDEGTLNEVCLEVEFIPPPPPFLRGDANGNGEVEPIADSLRVLRWQFGTGDPPYCDDAADVDDDGAVIALIDVVALLGWGFQDGSEPAAPGTAECGDDPTDDAMECEDEATCL